MYTNVARTTLWIKSLGWSGAAGLIVGSLTLVVSVVNFLRIFPGTKMDPDQAVFMLLGLVSGVSLLLVSNNASNKSQLRELKDEIGITESKILTRSREFGIELAKQILSTREFVNDTRVNLDDYYDSVDDPQKEYRSSLTEMINAKKITFRRVETIHNETRLRLLINRLYIHRGMKYFVRYYPMAKNSSPTLNLMSFDNETFYIGGFHTASSSRSEMVLKIRSKDITKIMSDYWITLWDKAIPINENGETHLSLISIAKSIGIDEEKLKNIVMEITGKDIDKFDKS